MVSCALHMQHGALFSSCSRSKDKVGVRAVDTLAMWCYLLVIVSQTMWLCSHCAEFAQGMVLPTGTSINLRNSSNGQSTAAIAPSASLKGQVECSPAGCGKSSGLRIPTRKLSGEEEFQCTAEDLYLALTENERVEAFTRSVAQVDACKGGQFVLFGGNITGTFVELVSGIGGVQSGRVA